MDDRGCGLMKPAHSGGNVSSHLQDFGQRQVGPALLQHLSQVSLGQILCHNCKVSRCKTSAHKKHHVGMTHATKKGNHSPDPANLVFDTRCT